MQTAKHYREKAERARRLGNCVVNRPEITEALERFGQELDEVATQLESGTTDTHQPEQPQALEQHNQKPDSENDNCQEQG